MYIYGANWIGVIAQAFPSPLLALQANLPGLLHEQTELYGAGSPAVRQKVTEALATSGLARGLNRLLRTSRVRQVAPKTAARLRLHIPPARFDVPRMPMYTPRALDRQEA